MTLYYIRPIKLCIKQVKEFIRPALNNGVPIEVLQDYILISLFIFKA